MIRSVFCPFYRGCLDKAVRENLGGFDCTQCEYRNLKIEEETEFTEYWLLLWAVFKPKLYRQYRQAETERILKMGKKEDLQNLQNGRDQPNL